MKRYLPPTLEPSIALNWHRTEMIDMRRSFTTVDDVVAYLLELEPGFDELDPGTLQDVVRSRTLKRYEDIEQDELDAMYQAALEQVAEADGTRADRELFQRNLARLARARRDKAT